ncbi:MAG: sugar transferase [Pseudomonadota bacterium]
MSLHEANFAHVDLKDRRETSTLQSIGFRVFDLAVTFMLLPIVIPAVLVAAAAIKLSDPKAPAFFSQTRYGLNGKPFKIFKLRTMVPNAEAMKDELLELSADKGQGFKIERDPRITKIGRILRKSYFDELPQFLNVLKGDMSVVGPRANSYHPSTYEAWQLKRLNVKPGLTGDWQVSRAKSYDFADRCKIDNEYVEHKTVLGDLILIFKTAQVVVCRSGQ